VESIIGGLSQADERVLKSGSRHYHGYSSRVTDEYHGVLDAPHYRDLFMNATWWPAGMTMRAATAAAGAAIAMLPCAGTATGTEKNTAPAARPC
jgi:hypothetical protein